MTTALEDRPRPVESLDFFSLDLRQSLTPFSVSQFALCWINLLIEAEPCPIGETLHRIEEGQPGIAHNKVDGPAMRSASKAMVKALIIPNSEGRRPLRMKWTRAKIFAPAPLQGDVGRDNRDDGD